ncbi:MAG: D-glycero-beta-D-manno-heptose-7-phosphate kinase [Candidatus Omnitrophica bacterium]|nr:D-glycero-beta-D-manno-heptose-7-phosphate kinase [Candidatus Omnitrophota bacterium]
MPDHSHFIKRFKARRLLVIGDVVLDQYIKGSVSRISPEAPVPIVLQEESFYTPGGAANVANNLVSLGADVTLVGKIGDDIEGAILKRELLKRGIRSQGLFIDGAVSTIFKTRIIAQHQQIIRLDREKCNQDGLDLVKESKILPFIRRQMKNFDAVIVSDYGKGMIDARMLSQLHELALQCRLPVIVDPKLEDLREYGQVSCITPNKKEAETALKGISFDARKAFGIVSTKLESKDDIEANGTGLLNYLGIESLLITLGEQGMYLFEHNKKPLPIPTVARQVFDVSGAGDTVIATFALCLAAGADKPLAAKIANHAAGIVVGKMGAVAVELEELKQALRAVK